MKVLLANGTAYPTIGGVENSLNYMAQALLQRRHEVKIFCFRRSPDEPLRCMHNGVEIIRVDFQCARRPDIRLRDAVDVTATAINELLREFEPDEIWTRWSAMGLGVAKSRFNGAIKNIFPTTARMDSKGLYLNTEGLPLVRRLLLLALWPLGYSSSMAVERELLKSCQAVVFSELMARQLSETYQCAKDRIVIVRPGVDTEIFSAKNATRYLETIEEKYSISRNKKYVLYVGRLAASKNITLLVNALKLLTHNVQLIAVGDGGEEDRLKRYVAANRMTDRVIFVGSQSDYLPAFYALATVCVLPTIVESFGQTYLEAMSCGTPVVGFASNGREVMTATQEIVLHGVTGQVVTDISARGLARAIDKILSLKPDAYSEISNNAREDVKKRFNWARFLGEMLEIPKETN